MRDTTTGAMPTRFEEMLPALFEGMFDTDLVICERDDSAETIELANGVPPKGFGRCRLRIFRITTGKEAGRWAVFFYKPSAVPHCRDRYSYGAAVFNDLGDPIRLKTWLDYLASEFDPNKIPAGVHRALTFSLPEFDPVPTTANGTSRCGPAGDVKSEAPARVLNPGELEIDLFCRGMKIDPSCTLEADARVLSRTRAGLGSGVEMVVPGPLKDLWMNVPVEEDFAQESPYRLVRFGPGDYRVVDERMELGRGFAYHVRLPPEPAWYRESTRNGTLMSRVGVLQGTYLGIYISNSCGFWYHKPEAGCQFCTTGLNVGVNEVAHKDVADVVDVALAARRESGNTFVHLNSGFHGGDRDLDIMAPYVRALKEEVGALIGVQVVPSPNLEKYDRLIELGVNHFSFCYEFHNPEYFARYLPGKDRLIGQKTFFTAMEYCTKKLGKGSCSGEIIAGVEPIEDTIRAIDYITGVGAFPTVCIFRPTIGSAMERHPSPKTDEMIDVMRYMYEACRRNGLPIGVAPNIEVSLIVNPDDARYLVDANWKVRMYEAQLALMKMAAKPYFARQLRPRKPAATTVVAS
jgi:hypothetical protein